MTGAVLLSFAACTESESRTFQADLSVDDISTADFTGDGVSDFVLEARVGTAHNVYLLDGSTDLDFASGLQGLAGGVRETATRIDQQRPASRPGLRQLERQGFMMRV